MQQRLIGTIGFMLVLIISSGPNTYAQSAALDEERWEELREELTYEGEADTTEARARSAERNRNIELSTGAKYFLIGLLLLGLGVLLYIALRDYWRKPKEQTPEAAAVLLEEVAEDRLTLVEAEQLIARAEANRQWHVAIRLHFLALLKELQDQHRITWQRNKTNRDYHYELESAPDYRAFAQLAAAYESAWYGAHTPTEASYRRLAEDFRHFRVTSRSYAKIPQV